VEGWINIVLRVMITRKKLTILIFAEKKISVAEEKRLLEGKKSID
jgi:hypothetical protein